MVTPFNVFVLLVAAVMVISTAVQFSKRKITLSWALFWSGLWVVGTAAVFFTGWIDWLGAYLIDGQGKDLAVYVAIIVLFYLFYKLYLTLQRQNESISRLVEELAKQKRKR